MAARSPVPVAVAVCVLAASAAAQEVRDLALVHRAGQTFLTWRESAGATGYRVYRSSSRFSSSTSLDDADFLGEVDDESSRNDARSQATNQEHNWVIAPGGQQLGSGDGLFVHTVAEGSARSYYAVTSVRNGVEDRGLKSGWNTNTNALAESAAPPQPVLQSSDASGELWAHWVGNRETPYLPALSEWPSQGFDFRFDPGSGAGPRGLVLALHAAGQTYAQAWPHRFELPSDVDRLSPSDVHPYTAFSFWYGGHERLPDLATPSTRVRSYTARRVLWTLDWMAARLGSAHDPGRVYAIGGSMGAIGAMLLASEAPERFAAIFCRNGLYDLEADDYRNPALFNRLLGDFDLGLLTESGVPVLDRWRAAHMANVAPAQDWPVIRTISGRNDETVGWSSSVQLFAGLAAAYRPAVHYFDDRIHTPQGYWAALERTLLARTVSTRRDRPVLHVSRCTLDEDAGDGTRTDGDPIGALNAYVEFDRSTARATPGLAEFDVFLRSEGALDDAPAATGWAALTPRRASAFELVPGEHVRYVLTEGNAIVDEHVLVADEDGLVHTPRTPLERASRHARFERWSPGPTHLFLGAGPIRGDYMQAVVSGTPGTTYTLALGIGDSSGAPFDRPWIDHVLLRGVFGATGVVHVWLQMPLSLPRGTWIWGRVYTLRRWWPDTGVAVQSWP